MKDCLEDSSEIDLMNKMYDGMVNKKNINISNITEKTNHILNKKSLKETKSALFLMLSELYEYIILSDDEEFESLNDILNIDDEEEKIAFKDIVGISLNNFNKYIIKTNIINIIPINKLMIESVLKMLDKKFLEKIDKMYSRHNNKDRNDMYTSPVLVEESLDRFPELIWFDPHKTWCNPFTKNGIWLGHICFRLMEGLKGWEKNKEKRYNHIKNNMLFGYNRGKRNKYRLNKLFNGSTENEYKNIFNEDFLESMRKFDVIIGNPPYQDIYRINSSKTKLYTYFVKKSLELINESGIISFLTPSTIFRKSNTSFNLYNTVGLKSIDYTSSNYFPSLIKGTKVTSWVLEKGYTDKVEITNMDNTIDFRNISDLLVEKKSLVMNKIYNKIKTNKNRLFIRDLRHSKNIDNGKYKIIVNKNKDKKSYSNNKPLLYGNKKMVISTSQIYKKEKLFISDEDFGSLYVCLNINDYTEKQINNVKDFLFSDTIINLVNNYKIEFNTGFNDILKFLPEININKQYTENEIEVLLGI